MQDDSIGGGIATKIRLARLLFLLFPLTLAFFQKGGKGGQQAGAGAAAAGV